MSNYGYPPPPYLPPTPPPKPSHRLRNAMIVVSAMIVTAGIAIAGVWVATRTGDGSRSEAASSPTTTDKSSTPDADLVEQKRRAADCRRDLGRWLRTLNDIDSRLSIGMSQSEYSAALGDVQIAYDRIDFDQIDVDCISEVGVPAENAFNQYVKANNRWDACIFDYDCDLDVDAMPKIQDRWARATLLLEKAGRNMETLGQTESSIS
jgi:hypothetical protein